MDEDRGFASRVTVYTRPGCHLCAAAVSTVARVCSDLSVSYTEVNIDSDPALRAEFGEQVPVTFVEGRQHDFWVVDEHRLRSAIG